VWHATTAGLNKANRTSINPERELRSWGSEFPGHIDEEHRKNGVFYWKTGCFIGKRQFLKRIRDGLWERSYSVRNHISRDNMVWVCKATIGKKYYPLHGCPNEEKGPARRENNNF